MYAGNPSIWLPQNSFINKKTQSLEGVWVRVAANGCSQMPTRALGMQEVSSLSERGGGEWMRREGSEGVSLDSFSIGGRQIIGLSFLLEGA